MDSFVIIFPNDKKGMQFMVDAPGINRDQKNVKVLLNTKELPHLIWQCTYFVTQSG